VPVTPLEDFGKTLLLLLYRLVSRVRKFLNGVYVASNSMILLSVLVYVGISGTQQYAGAAYGGMLYDQGNSTAPSLVIGMSDNSMTTMATNETSMEHHMAIGNIANIQLDSSRSPAWIQSGIWVMRASFSQNSTEPESVWLMSKFAMVKPDGTARHMHKIYDFQPSEFTTEQNNTIHVVKGIATVTMKDGPVSGVPLTIKVFNGSVIGLWIGPDKVDSHFGSDPIYGILSEKLAMMMEMGSMQGGGQMTDQGPKITPSNFVSGVTNPFYPLTPGTTYTYQSETEDGTEKNIVIVTNETRNILGITTIVVWDRVWQDEDLVEETHDWYAQDKEGNVWYFGEDSKEYDGMDTNTDGSWEAGVDGAEPGIIMEASPKVGDSYMQEYYKGHAEDMGDVVSLAETVSVPFGTFTDCLQTRDWSKLETSLNEYKYYCKDVGGLALEVEIDSGVRVELVDVK